MKVVKEAIYASFFGEGFNHMPIERNNKDSEDKEPFTENDTVL